MCTKRNNNSSSRTQRIPAKGSEMQEGTNSTGQRTSKLVLFKTTTMMMPYSVKKVFMYPFVPMEQNPRSLKHGMYILASVPLSLACPSVEVKFTP